MTTSKKKSFTAVLEPDGTRLRWVIARVPFDIAKVWPVRKGRRVRGSIEGFEFRTSLFPDPRGEGTVLLVNKQMQTAAGARAGTKVRIVLEPDLEERVTETPTELAEVMRGARGLKKWVEQLSPSRRREIAKWVSEPKSTATREKRARRMAEWLLQVMEGEQETPPILRAAFRRQPLAEKGWQELSATQRRNHLLGIFHYETPEARERRAAKAIEEALQAARRHGLG